MGVVACTEVLEELRHRILLAGRPGRFWLGGAGGVDVGLVGQGNTVGASEARRGADGETGRDGEGRAAGNNLCEFLVHGSAPVVVGLVCVLLRLYDGAEHSDNSVC